MSAPLKMPPDLLQAFKRFLTDFNRVTAAWVCRDIETAADVAIARAGLRDYMADPADPDAFGVSRHTRLLDVFEFWRGLAQQVGGGGVAVQPVLPVEMMRRHLDREWLAEKQRGVSDVGNR